MTQEPNATSAHESVTQVLDRALPREVRTICRVLSEAGHRCWVVGGSVRDVLLSLDRRGSQVAIGAADWDLCTDARPPQVQKLFRRVIPTGIEHGTVTVVLSKQHFEVTTLRGETTYSDGRRPDDVFFVDDLEQDLARRDFTVNAIAYDVEARTLHDPYGGREDLKAGILRAVGNPLERFEEDGLRVLRGARFAATLELELEENTRAAIRPSLGSFRKVAQERVRDEWFKALKSRAPSRALRILRDEGLLAITASDLFAEGGDFELACRTLDVSSADPVRRFALLCRAGFNSADQARRLASHLKLSGAERTRVGLLFEQARLPDFARQAPSGAALRRWLANVGRDQLEDVLTMQHDATPLFTEDDARVTQFARAARDEASSGAALSPKELDLSGKDLIAAGFVPGPELGRTLQRLFEAVLDEPSLNDREQLLSLASADRA